MRGLCWSTTWARPARLALDLLAQMHLHPRPCPLRSRQDHVALREPPLPLRLLLPRAQPLGGAGWGTAGQAGFPDAHGGVSGRRCRSCCGSGVLRGTPASGAPMEAQWLPPHPPNLASQRPLQSPCGHSSALNSTKLPKVDFISLFRRFQLFLEVQGFPLIKVSLYANIWTN